MKYLKYILWFLCFLPMLLLRDYTPDNELRYLSIADEALANGNLFTFYNLGEPYADKPPLYLWIVMIGRLILGQHSMLFLGLFSILPGFVILWLMDKWTSEVINEENRLTAQLMLITTGFFVGAMVVLRMDILMTMFITLALYTFYQAYVHRKAKSWWMFSIWVFLALFTKGPYGVMIPIASVFVFLLFRKEYKFMGAFLGWKTWTIILLFCILWFGAVYWEGGKEYLDNLLFNQTVNRAVDSFSHKKGPFFYLTTFWHSAAPWSLFYGAMLLALVRYRVIYTKLEQFFLTIILVTFCMLSLISSKLEIYLLPIYPFVTYLSILILQKIGNQKWIKLFIMIPAFIFSLVLPVLIFGKGFIPEISLLNNTWIYIGGGLLTLTGIYSFILLFNFRGIQNAVNVMATGILLTVFIISFAIPAFNSQIGYRNLAKRGQEIAIENNLDTFYAYRVSRAGGMNVYLGQQVEEIGRDQYIEQLQAREKGILFLRNRDITKDEVLQEMISEKKRYIEGDYSIVVW